MTTTINILDMLLQAFDITSDNFQEVEVDGEMIDPFDLKTVAREHLEFLRTQECRPTGVDQSQTDDHTLEDCKAKFHNCAPFGGYPWPATVSDDLVEILGRPSGTWHLFAPFYRQTGTELPDVREINFRDYDYVQAFFLHKALTAYFTHGNGWLQALDAELASLKEQIIANER